MSDDTTRTPFVSIIWGYHAQLFNFTPVENYHLHALKIAKELGYTPEVYLIAPRVAIENDPNFDPDITVTHHRGTRGMIRFLWKHRNSVVYANTVIWQNFVLVPILCRFAVFMAGDSIRRRSWLKQKIETLALHGYWRVRLVAPGEKTFLLSEGIPKRKAWVVPMPLATDLFAPAATPGRDLVFLGNVTPDNDFPTILAALALVSQKIPDIKLHILGEVRIPEWDALVAENTVQGNIVLHGQQTHAQIASILPSFSICVSSVISSGQHLSIYESALAGLGLCIPNTMQFNSVFTDMALFHELYDSAGLAHNILQYLEQPALRSTHAQKAERLVREQFTAEVLEPKMKALFTR